MVDKGLDVNRFWFSLRWLFALNNFDGLQQQHSFYSFAILFICWHCWCSHRSTNCIVIHNNGTLTKWTLKTLHSFSIIRYYFGDSMEYITEASLCEINFLIFGLMPFIGKLQCGWIYQFNYYFPLFFYSKTKINSHQRASSKLLAQNFHQRNVQTKIEKKESNGRIEIDLFASCIDDEMKRVFRRSPLSRTRNFMFFF